MALSRVGKCCRSFLREPSKAVFCGVIQPGWIEGCIGAKRHLLSEEVIKLQDYQLSKLTVAHLATGSQGNYVDLFSQKLQRNELILRDELKLLLHLCHSVEDLQVARDAIYRYHKENRNFAFGEFKFGPLFMRLCYEMNQENVAAATITDKDMQGFFADTTSFNIALDMLFMKGCYESVLEVLRTMTDQHVLFSKDTLLVAAATCYKQNTVESYKTCIALIEEKLGKSHFLYRRTYCFAVALALQQNDLEKAQSFYSQILAVNNRICQNLKVVMLAKSGAVADAVSILSAAILPESPLLVKKIEFSQEVVDLLHLQSEDSPLRADVKQIVTRLEQAGQVTRQTLDDMLCCPHTGKRETAPSMIQRKISQRTLRPLRSSLLAE